MAVEPVVVSGISHRALAARIADELGTGLAPTRVERFPDGELEVKLEAEVRGRPLVLVQPLAAPVGESLLELLLIADAGRRAGATSLVGVVPYMAYARQDRVRSEGQPLGARVIADALATAELSQTVVVDLHSAVMASCLRGHVAHLSAVSVLAGALASPADADAVFVAPDFGALKLAEAYARPLGAPMAVVHKVRSSGAEVVADAVVGDVRGRRPIIVDDMISTGATVDAAVDVLLRAGCRSEITVVATHGLFVGKAVDRLSRSEIARVVVTDSLPPPSHAPARLQVVPLGPLLAEAVRRLMGQGSLGALLAAR